MKVIRMAETGDGYQPEDPSLQPAYIVLDDEGNPKYNLTAKMLDEIVTAYFKSPYPEDEQKKGDVK